MAEEQSKIAAEQVPIYDKALETQLGSSGTSEGTATSATIEAPQPPASNPGADNPTGGISEGAGGLSSTAHIESPVPNNEQGLLSTVKGIFGFGKPEEIKAEDKGPAEDATTAPASSVLAGSAITGSVVAAMGSSGSSSSTPAAGNSQSTSTSSDPSAGANKGIYLDNQQAAFPSSQTLPIRSTPGGSLLSETSSTAKTDTKSTSTESTTDRTISKTDDDDNDSSRKVTGSDNRERSEPHEHKPPQPADGKPSGRHGMENVNAIPTAGGKRLGEENWGESKIVPDDPKPQSDSAGVSSEAGQPTDQVRDNTAKNTGGATSGPQGGNGKGEEKEKFVDKIKDKLNIGKK